MLRSLVILQGYDSSGPTTHTFYLTNGTPFITAPGETPASQTFDPTLAQPFDARRRMQSIGGGRSLPTIGEIRVHNTDGAYDDWADYAFDGRAITVRTGPAQGAYPSEYPVTFTGTMDRVDVQGDEIVIRVRDVLAELATPLQDALYAGDNTPPDGLEGGEDLAGRRKPLVFGRVKGMQPVLVNAAKQIYQVSDGAIAQVDEVYDNGIRLGAYTPYDWGTTQTTYGGYCLATDGTTLVMGGTSGGNPAIYTSTDGTSFSAIGSLPFVSSGTVVGIARNPATGRWCAVTDNATGEIATSDDSGATWTLRTAAAAVSFNRVRFCPRRGLYIAVADGGAIHTSPDAETWTARTSGTAQHLFDVAVGGAYFVAVGASGALTRSADGATWTATTLGVASLTAAFWHDGLYYVGAPTATIHRSEESFEWTSRSVATVGVPWEFAAADGYVVCAMQVANTRFLAAHTLDRGLSWQANGPDYNTNGPAFGLVPFEDRWYVCTAAGATPATHASGVPGTYADLAELEDDDLEPAPGSYKYVSDANGSYVRLGSSPVGTVTADVTQGANDAARTAGQLFAAVLTHRGYSSGDWSASDITALDTADNAVCGIVVDNDEPVVVVLDALARTVGAWWGVDASGVIRIAQLTAPSGSSTFDVTANDLRAKLQRLTADDPFVGLPSTKTTLRWARTSSPLLDGTATDTDATVLTTHLLARETIEDSYFTALADAEAEAARRQTLRGTRRHAYRAVVSLEDYADIELGQVGTLTHARFGLDAGVLVRVIAVEPNARERSVTLTLWR